VSDHLINDLREFNKRLDHYDAPLWEALIFAQHVQVRARQLADELRRLATAHPHIRQRMIDEAVVAWGGGDEMMRTHVTRAFCAFDGAIDTLREQMHVALDPARREKEDGQ